MKSVLYFMSFVLAATALLAACGKSSNNTASVPNNCGVGQGYSSTGGCLQLNSNQCQYQSTGQLMGMSSSGTCYAVECVNSGSGCAATNTGGYYNNGTYTNGYYGGYGGGYNTGYYGSGYNSFPNYSGSGYGSTYYNGYNIAYPYSGGGYNSGYGYGYPSSGGYVNGGFYVHF